MPDEPDPTVRIEYTIAHVVDGGIEIGFVATYLDPVTDEERTFVADTYDEAERLFRLDVVKRLGIDAVVTDEEA